MASFVLVHGAWHGSWCWKRVRSLVYVDAFVLEDSESLAQHVPAEQYKLLFEGANTRGEGWKVPPIPGEVFNVNAQDLRWMNQQCTPHPIECFRQQIKLTGSIQKITNVTFILATGWNGSSPFPPFYEKAKAKGWKTRTLSCGHDVMLDLPEELTKMLVEAM